ncbi:cytochrome c peroxidase [Methylomonas rosea]|uniref:Cytochrome C peroxidase n=1 Tax=Methylomonas rosea TaxID=2952227 RepID=A0ABT1TR61_9GAMM|nr:cytochrome c peroxidase [Methylomonas sp. WSC-7]MCQ8117266.1 cytochrome C peroxidase [Methylomonas sp. WSC-7]
MNLIGKLMLGVGGLLLSQVSFSHGPQPMPLQGVPVPHVQGFLQEKQSNTWVNTAVNFLPEDGADSIVIDKQKAIALGKALFWDVNVGSDGMSCGSCHFHAGADARTKNQINPGLKSSNASGQTFQPLPSGALSGGPNYQLTQTDFPTYKFNDPLNKASGLTFATDDVVSSAGTFSGDFTGVSKFVGSSDQCNRAVNDPIFHLDSTGTRRVEPRNAPTVFNAVFNHRNFWDGRANNIYNGSSPWGDRDENAGVWVKTASKVQPVKKNRLHLENASLASLAMGPPLNDAEMACRQRTWPEIGRKLLLRQPLQNQKVHNEDSVLGPISLSSAGNLKPGLNTTYKQLVMQSFNPKFWSYASTGPFGSRPGQPPYNQIEANFSMFFGIALQLYQSTLISDQAPVDLTQRDAFNIPTWQGLGYSSDKVARIADGFNIFTNNHCNLCHAGPLLTSAAISTNSALLEENGKFFGPSYAQVPYGPDALGLDNATHAIGVTKHPSLVNRDLMSGVFRMYDLGFANTGVNDPNADIGLGANDDFGNPLSFAKQYVQYLLGAYANVKDPGVNQVRACDFIIALAYESNSTSSAYFTTPNGIQADGSREGVARDQDCVTPEYAFIPTVAAANTAQANTPGKLGTVTSGVFKIPTLRNIELTGPYMHNGSMSTLKQVIEFYSRKGNFDSTNKHQFVNNISLASASETARANLIEFLETLTDDRVRYEKAPFDHPELKVPHGHTENGSGGVVDGNSLSANLALDDYLEVPAVGANGRTNKLLPFHCQLGPIAQSDPLYSSCQP